MSSPSQGAKTLGGVVFVALMVAAGWFFGFRPRPAPGQEILLTPSAARPTLAANAALAPPNPILTILPPTSTVAPTATAAVKKIAVYVNGAVNRAGVYTLPDGSRVVDALELAGGLLPSADADIVNQAALLKDGQQVYIPYRGTPVPPGLQSGGAAAPPAKTAASPTSSGPINLNTATRADLDSLPGIGPTLADRILEYRQQHGPFKRIEDLKNVSGIGDKLFEGLKSRVTAP